MTVFFNYPGVESSQLFIKGVDHHGWKYQGRGIRHLEYTDERNSEGHLLPAQRCDDWVVPAIFHIFVLHLHHKHPQVRFRSELENFLHLVPFRLDLMSQQLQDKHKAIVEERGPFLSAEGQINMNWLDTRTKVVLKKARFGQASSKAMQVGDHYISIKYEINGASHVLLYYFDTKHLNSEKDFICHTNGAPYNGAVMETFDAGEHGHVLYITEDVGRQVRAALENIEG